jgi:hypothetical protein
MAREGRKNQLGMRLDPVRMAVAALELGLISPSRRS